MRGALLLLLAAALAPAPARAWEDGYDDPPPIQRYLAELQLGDSLEEVQRIYPPAQPWPSYIEPRGRVTRYRVERSYVKMFPAWTHAMMLGFKRGRLVDIQVIYTAKRSGELPSEELARDLSLTYGEGERSSGKFWWTDDSTVLRVFPVQVPTFKDGVKGVEWRTSMQILDKGLYQRVD